jgi:hypothetical protein
MTHPLKQTLLFSQQHHAKVRSILMIEITFTSDPLPGDFEPHWKTFASDSLPTWW